MFIGEQTRLAGMPCVACVQRKKVGVFFAAENVRLCCFFLSCLLSNFFLFFFLESNEIPTRQALA